MCKTWDRIRIWIGIKMESRIRIGIKTMPILGFRSLPDKDAGFGMRS
jgi:hypothetical protein